MLSVRTSVTALRWQIYHCFQTAYLSLLSDGSNPIFRKAEVQIGIDVIAALIRLYALKVLPNLQHTSLTLAQHTIDIAPKY